MVDIYKTIEDFNPNKKRKILIIFELFIRGRKLNISLVFITQSYFAVPKDITLNSTHYFIMKIPNKQQLQETAFTYSSDLDFKDFMYLYKKCTAKLYSILVIDTTLASDNLLRFKMNLIERILKLIVTTDDKTEDENLQYDINREAA